MRSGEHCAGRHHDGFQEHRIFAVTAADAMRVLDCKRKQLFNRKAESHPALAVVIATRRSNQILGKMTLRENLEARAGIEPAHKGFADLLRIP